MRKSIVSLLAAGLALQGGAVFAHEDPRTLSVTGVGRVEVLPDQATVSYEVSDEAPASLGQFAAYQAATTANRQKVQANQAYLKSIVGENGTVEVVPSLQEHREYNDQTKKWELVGYKVTSRISVTLKGRGAMDEKLGKLFDSSKIKADSISSPYFGLSDEASQAAEISALKRAVSNGVNKARAQLEPGEVLGAAISRGRQIEVPRPRFERAMAAPKMAGAGPGGAADMAEQAVVESGKVSVTATVNFLYQVAGQPARMAKQATQTVIGGMQRRQAKRAASNAVAQN